VLLQRKLCCIFPYVVHSCIIPASGKKFRYRNHSSQVRVSPAYLMCQSFSIEEASEMGNRRFSEAYPVTMRTKGPTKAIGLGLSRGQQARRTAEPTTRS